MPQTAIDQHARGTRLAIALGDPAGIGAEVTLKALAHWPTERPRPLLVGCRHWLESCYQQLKQTTTMALADPGELDLLDQPLGGGITIGTGNASSGDASFQWLTTAVEQVHSGRCQALVTAPIAKHAWHAAGHDYPGQTERLAELGGTAEASMLFTARSARSGWRLNTLLATTHIPLSDVPQVLNAERIAAKLDVLRAFCKRFTNTPHLVVAGLNPHAGEAGRLGQDEQQWLEPALRAWQQRHPDTRLSGPRPPDTCWLDAAEAWQQPNCNAADGYLALYHDQGLIPVKLLAFDQAVNTSLGLPFLRTSPDHGTGFNIAGAGIARSASMLAAMETAFELG